MKAPIFRAYVRRTILGTCWQATVRQPAERSCYGRPSTLPVVAGSRAEAIAEAADFAHMYQNEPQDRY
jgi:hypothetical protein